MARFLNEEGVVVIWDAVKEKIAAESNRADGIESSLDSKIDTEISRAELAESELQTSIDNINTDITSHQLEFESFKVSNTTAIGTAKSEAIQTASDDATSKANQALADAKVYADGLKDSILGGASEAFDTLVEVETYIKEHGVEAQNFLANINANKKAIDAEIVRATGMENALDTAIKNEQSRAENREEANASSIAGEITRATTAEANLQTAINTENTRAVAAEAVNAKAVADEEKRALAAEEVLRAADTAIVSSVGEERSRATAKENEISTSVANLKLDYETTKQNYNLHVVDYTQYKIDTANNITAAQNAAISTAATDATSKADKALADAKEYTDLTKQLILGDGVSTAFDTLKEVEEWITTHKGDAGTLLTNVNKNAADIAAEVSRATRAEEDLSDAIAAEVLTARRKEDAITANLATEKESRKSQDNILSDSISTERERALAAEDAIDERVTEEVTKARAKEAELLKSINDEISRAKGKENSIEGLLSNEVSRATEKETELTSAIHEETERATGKETDLLNSISDINAKYVRADNELSSRLGQHEQEFEQYKSDVTLAISSAKSTAIETASADATSKATKTLEAAKKYTNDMKNTILGNGYVEAFDTLKEVSDWISTHSTQATDFITKINLNKEAIAAEKTRAESVEQSLRSSINTETTRATGVETTLKTTINTEISNARANEETIKGLITAETNRATTKESEILGKITAEDSRAKAAEKIISDSLNDFKQNSIDNSELSSILTRLTSLIFA